MHDMKKWIEENPLRKFRKKHGLSMMNLASLVGAGMSTIQTWESGAHLPKPESFEAMAKVTGIDNIEQLWVQWLKQKPTFTNK